MEAHKLEPMTAEEYLAFDRRSDIKHEFVTGHSYAMAGGTAAHSRLAIRVVHILESRLQSEPCRTFNSDMRIRVDAQRYFYPDASVSCSQLPAAGDDILDGPTVVVEVLSDGTERYDRGDKFAEYRRSPSLREYVLVSQHRPSVEVFRKTGAFWVLYPFGPGETVVLESIDVQFGVDELYLDVPLSADTL